MNKNRRKEIKTVIDELDKLGARIEELRDEEQGYFDNMPEGIQWSEKGDAVQETIDDMDEAIDSIQNCVDALNAVIG